MGNIGERNSVDFLCELGAEYLFLGSLISSDTLINLEECEKSRRELDNFSHDLKLSQVDEEKKKELQELIDKAYELIKQEEKNYGKVDSKS